MTHAGVGWAELACHLRDNLQNLSTALDQRTDSLAGTEERQAAMLQQLQVLQVLQEV